MATLGFGKYADLPLEEVPDQYLLWLIAGSRVGLDEHLVWQIEAALHENAMRRLAETLARSRKIGQATLKLVCAQRHIALRRGVEGPALAALNQQIYRLFKNRKKVTT